MSETLARELLPIGQAAIATRENLVLGWKRPVRHNARIERDSLWCALELDHRSKALIADDFTAPSGVRAPYQICAGLLVLQHCLPFAQDERKAIRAGESGSVPTRDPESRAKWIDALISRWRDWLWIDGEPSTRGQQPNPEALLLAEGCARLAQSVGAVLLAHEQQEAAPPDPPRA
jgi:hypothetical protein